MTDRPFRVCPLWSRTTKDGRHYLAGRWGGAKVLVMPNPNAGGPDDASHHLCLAEADPPRERDTTTRSRDRSDQPVFDRSSAARRT